MTVILLKAGLGLDPATLVRLSLVVVRLGMCPCVVEAVTIAAISHFLLGYPWLWALVLGYGFYEYIFCVFLTVNIIVVISVRILYH